MAGFNQQCAQQDRRALVEDESAHESSFICKPDGQV
jgi:hypothetical protein